MEIKKRVILIHLWFDTCGLQSLLLASAPFRTVNMVAGLIF
jgi:hypothetical protein